MHSLRAVATTAVAILLLALVASWPRAHAESPAAATTRSAREVTTREQLNSVRAEIAKIAHDQRATVAQRDAIDAKLAAQGDRISAAVRAVRETDAAIAAGTEALAGLQAQRARLLARQAGQRAALVTLLRAAYALERGAALPLLLGNQDTSRTTRALAYARYFQRDMSARIQKLQARGAELDQLGSSIKFRTHALRQQRVERQAHARQLATARDAARELLAKADAKLSTQKNRLATLRHNAKALDQLLKRLQDLFADIPPAAGASTPFARLRGKLALPVAGKLHAATGALAQGIMITASPGAKVHAVAYGRVAWANFMRGYGMLVIVDQGDGWMSLYGGNDAALVTVGDWVKPGQPIATIGQAHSPPQAWFGLRHDGRPVDPRGWFSAKP